MQILQNRLRLLLLLLSLQRLTPAVEGKWFSLCDGEKQTVLLSRKYYAEILLHTVLFACRGKEKNCVLTRDCLNFKALAFICLYTDRDRMIYFNLLNPRQKRDFTHTEEFRHICFG